MKITRLLPAFVAAVLSLGLAVFANTRTQGSTAPAGFQVADANLKDFNPEFRDAPGVLHSVQGIAVADAISNR
ncbi:MAG TPA: hypothetical protein VK717_08570 [Opitutaceae bacterium]|jgi:hypothetical protein|nr:hypothetical protein [Opitutaceae bacterium]